MDSNKEVEEKLLHGFVNTNDEINNTYKKRITKISIIIIIIIALRIIFGPLVIPNFLGFPTGYNRYFLIKYNDNAVSVDYKLVNKTPLIPFLIYVKSSYKDTSKYTSEDISTTYITDEDNIKVDVKSYACYSGKSRIKCDYYSNNLKKEKKLTLESIKITHTNKPYKVVYDGPYVSDIGKFITDKGSYTITITGKYRRNKVTLDTYIIKKQHQISWRCFF